MCAHVVIYLYVFTFVFFLCLIPPEAVSFDEGDVLVAPPTPRGGGEIGTRETQLLGDFDLDEFFDDVVAAEKSCLQP